MDQSLNSLNFSLKALLCFCEKNKVESYKTKFYKLENGKLVEVKQHKFFNESVFK